MNLFTVKVCGSVVASLGAVLAAGGCGVQSSPSRESDTVSTTVLALGSSNQVASITAKLSHLISSGVSVGSATSAVIDLPYSLAGQYQTFLNGVIVSSDDHGTVFMPLNIFNAWIATQIVDAGTRNGQPVKLIEVLGLPLSDVAMFKGAPAVTFERAQIVDNAGPKLIHGAIYARYWRLNNTPGAVDLGLPIGPESGSGGGGRFQQFQNGEILWRQDPLPPDADPTLVPSTPAWEMVPGDIYNAWMAPGRGLAPEGYPRGAPYVFKDGMGVVVGAFQRFENKALFFSPATGVARVNISADVLELYNQVGGPLGFPAPPNAPPGFPASPNPPLGFPVGEEQVTAAGTHFLQFQNGMIVTPSLQAVFPNEPKPRIFTNPKAFIKRVSSTGDDCNDPFGCGSLDPYWKLTANIIAPSPRLLYDVQYGNGSDWEKIVNEFHGQVPPFTPDLVIRTTLSGTDIDDTTRNDTFGPTNVDWNIDNLWGEIGGPLYRIPANNAAGELLNFEFLLQSNLPYNPKQLLNSQWWSFANFRTAELGWGVFAETFSNVGPEADWKHPFNTIFFDRFFKPIANGGNCFGMSLEAIDAREKRSVYNEPIYRFYEPFTGLPLNVNDDIPPEDKWHRLARAINIKQGSQLGNEVVDYFLGDFLMGRQHNPGYQFSEGFHYQLHGVPTFVSMTTSYLFENSHTVLATDYERDVPCQHPDQSGETCQHIHILNPNLPLLRVGGNPNNDEFIEVNTDRGTFSYWDTSYPVQLHYFGTSDGSLRGLNGRMYVIPYTLLVDKQHTPFTKWAELWSMREIILMSASGSVAQASDPSGRVLYEQADEPGRPKWDDLSYLDPAQQLPLAPFPFIASNSAPGTQMYVSGDLTGQTQSYEFALAPGRADGTPYDVVIEHALQSSAFTIPGTLNRRDKVTNTDIGTATKTTELSNPSDGVAKAVKWTFSGAEKQRWVELSNLGMSPTQRIRMRSEAAGSRVMVNNVAGPDTSASLRIKAGPEFQPVDIGAVDLPHGESVIDTSRAQCVSDTGCASGQRCLAGACAPLTFDPAQLRPLAWYQASSSTVLLTGGGVSEWKDSSFYGHHLTQPQSGMRPTYSATSWNGASPSVTFDGIDDFLEYAASGGSLLSALAGSDRPLTVLITWEPLDLDQDYDLMQWDNGGVNGGNSLIELRTNAAGGDESRYRHRRGDGFASIVNTGTPKFLLNRRTTGFVFTGKVLSIYDGGSVHLNAGANNVDPLTLVRYRLGHGDNTPLKGRIAEVVIVDFALKQSEFQLYRSYAQGKWGGL